MDLARTTLTGGSARPLARKIMIVMSDGMWNNGRNPTSAAADCAAAKITVHCISFLDAVNQDAMIAISAMTGGKFYSASNEAELIAAWENIARTLPIALTE
jgi:Mg-chelatase subunit ChlD